MRKYIFLCFVLTAFLFCLTGCYDARGVDTLSYAVAIGLDEGENNILKLTFQFATPGSSSGGSESQYTSTTITSVECNSISSGINLINSYTDKEVNLAHTKIIVFSEALAKKGLLEYVATLVNNVEIRPDCNIIVSKCNAEDYLNASNPSSETLSARYYELILDSAKYTGFTSNSSILDFFFSSQSEFSEPVAILGGVNTKSSHTTDSSTSFINVDDSYVAGQTPITSNTNLENMGLAVFRDDKLVGELTGFESLCYLLTINEFENSTISIPNPFKQNSNISLYMTKNKDTSVNVSLSNGSPYVKVSVNLNFEVLSMYDSLDLTSEENIRIIEDYTKSFIEEKLKSYLYKTSKELKSDIGGFGKKLSSNYLTIDEFANIKWEDLYKDAFFTVDAEVVVTSSELLSKD